MYARYGEWINLIKLKLRIEHIIPHNYALNLLTSYESKKNFTSLQKLHQPNDFLFSLRTCRTPRVRKSTEELSALLRAAVMSDENVTPLETPKLPELKLHKMFFETIVFIFRFLKLLYE